MPIKSYTVSEGVLNLGTLGTSIDATAQVEEITVEWEENVEDSRPTLSGEVLDGKATYAATLTAKLIQDLTDGGLVDFTWDNKGTVVPFELVPASAAERTITGNVRISPMNVGGPVNSKPASDVSWAIIGDPILGASL